MSGVAGRVSVGPSFAGMGDIGTACSFDTDGLVTSAPDWIESLFIACCEEGGEVKAGVAGGADKGRSYDHFSRFGT